MKLLFFCHAITGGGAERVLVELTNSFVSTYDVVIATDVKTTFAYELNSKTKVLDLYSGCSNRSSSIARIKNSIQIRRNIRSIVKEEQPDILVAFMGSLGATVVFSTLGMRIPVIICEHTTLSRNLGVIVKLRRMLSYPLASCVTVLTRSDFKQFGKKHKNMVRMPNPINVTEYVNTQQRNKVVLAVGRVDQWHVKGFDMLIQGWSQICHSFPEWHLDIAGKYDDKSLEYLQTLSDSLNCININYLGFRRDVKEIMNHAEVFCLSSRVEGLPMTLIEAMNAGCCCVSFDVKTGPNEIIKDGISGLLAVAQNVEDLSQKLCEVLSDENLRKAMRSNNHQSIQCYDLQYVIRRWEILFSKVCK